MTPPTPKPLLNLRLKHPFLQTETVRPLVSHEANKITGSLGYIWLVKSKSHGCTPAARSTRICSFSVFCTGEAECTRCRTNTIWREHWKNLGRPEWQTFTVINIPKSSLEFKLCWFHYQRTQFSSEYLLNIEVVKKKKNQRIVDAWLRMFLKSHDYLRICINVLRNGLADSLLFGKVRY